MRHYAIGQEVFIHGYIDEIRKDTVIIRNEGGYFGTVESEIVKQEPCDDAISRQAVIEYIEGSEAELGHSSENELVCQHIKEFPPVTPQSKIGHWINDRCSECGKGIEDLIDSHEWYRNENPKYCPFCGKKIQGVEE